MADAHLATFADIVGYDARNLEETLTEDFVLPIQRWNFPRSDRFYMRFVIDTESPDAEGKLKAIKSAWDMGMEIKLSDLADAAGIVVPTEIDAKVFNPQIVAQIRQMQIPGGGAAAGGQVSPVDPMVLAIKAGMAGGQQKPEVIHG